MLLQLRSIDYTPPNFARPLLTNISFSLAAGESVTLTGITGAGKSTLLRLLNRLSEPTSGQILLNGDDYRSRSVSVSAKRRLRQREASASAERESISPMTLRQQVMLVSQTPQLLGMNVREALAYPLQLQSLGAAEIKQRILTVADQFEIPTDWFDRNHLQLSVGQKQLVSIARGVITQPQVLLLDEPIASLDPSTAERVLTTINTICRSQNIGMIVVNHQLELAARFSDRLLYLHDGKLLIDKLSTAVDWQNLHQQIRESEDRSISEWD